jgi:hypothetical protein
LREFIVRADEKLTAVYGAGIGDSRGQRRTAASLRSLATQFAPQDSHAEQSETKQRNCRAAVRNSHGSGVDPWGCFNSLDKKKRGSCGQDK